MKILVISTPNFPVPLTGYGGTEQIAYELACQYQLAGHQVAMAAPEGSKLPEGMELIPVGLRVPEVNAARQYQARLPEFDTLHDHTFESWCYLDSTKRVSQGEPPLPIVKTHHTSPTVWGVPPPVQHPCLVGLSRSHARNLSLAYGVTVTHVYNGIDLDFYHPPAEGAKRSARLLFVGRYTPEKGPLDAMNLAKRLRIPLDCYGDTEITGNPAYVDRCRAEADGTIVRFFPGVPRAKTVELYQTYRGLLTTHVWPEPFGLVWLEAAACGLPVIAINTGAAAEVIKDGVSGYVCDDLRHVEQVLRDGCLRAIESQACRTWAEQFSREKMAQNYLDLFQMVQRGDCW